MELAGLPQHVTQTTESWDLQGECFYKLIKYAWKMAGCIKCCKSLIFNPNKLQVLVSTVLSVSEEVSSSRNQVGLNHHNKLKLTYSESIDLLFFTNNDPNQVEDLLRRLENAESDWNVVADSAPRWQMGGKAGMFKSQFHFEKTDLKLTRRPPAFQRGISELSAVTGRSEQCRMSQTDQQVFHRKASWEWCKITVEWNSYWIMDFPRVASSI